MGGLEQDANASEDKMKPDRNPQFEDFLKPNPFIYPWMLKFLPESRRSQDFAIVIIGGFVFFLIGVLAHELKFNDFIAAGIGLTGIAIIGGENEARYFIAGTELGAAKRQFKKK
jgi:hypothetical protein